MKSFVLALPCCCLALLPLNARGDIAEAEDAAWRMGVKYRDRGFYLQDVQQYGIMKVGNDDYRKFKLRIVKGLDYVFLTALDTAVDLVPGKPIPRKVAEKLEDIDLYVYSDVGQLIMSDSRDQDREGDAAPDGSKEKPFVLSMAGVQFRADYRRGSGCVPSDPRTSSGWQTLGLWVGMSSSATGEPPLLLLAVHRQRLARPRPHHYQLRLPFPPNKNSFLMTL